MHRWTDIAKTPESLKPCVVTLGNFDGVHRGHLAVIDQARRIGAAHGLPTVAVTFEPHPIAVLRPHEAPDLLTPGPLREDLLEAAGIDGLLVLDVTLVGEREDDIASAEARVDSPVDRLDTQCSGEALGRGPRTVLLGRIDDVINSHVDNLYTRERVLLTTGGGSSWVSLFANLQVTGSAGGPLRRARSLLRPRH